MSSTYLSHTFGWWFVVVRAVCSKSSMKMFATTGESGDPMSVPSFCSKKLSLYLKYIDLRHTCSSVR